MEHVTQGDVLIHKVSLGETVSEIAERYGVTTNEVLLANGLSSRDRIYPDQRLKVPGARGPVPKTQIVRHTVEQGETVTRIAEEYGTTVSEVLSLNELRSSDTIYPGQKIKVRASEDPATAGEVIVHEVKQGETVSSIAARYAASIDNVLETNGLKANDMIYPGQKLTIAAAAGLRAGGYHTVQEGETITSIARMYGVTVRSVLDVNRLGTRDTIYPGQKIKLPGR